MKIKIKINFSKTNTYLNNSLVKYILEHLTQKHKFAKDNNYFKKFENKNLKV